MRAIANSFKSGDLLGESITSDAGDTLSDMSHIVMVAGVLKLLAHKVLNLEEQLESLVSAGMGNTELREKQQKQDKVNKVWAKEIVQSYKKLAKLEKSPNYTGDILLSANLKDLVKFYLKKNYK